MEKTDDGRKEPDDERQELSPLAVGYMWSARITTIGVEMGLIALAGDWLDRRFGTRPVFVLVGGVIALVVLFAHLLAIVQHGSESFGGGGKK